MTLTELPDVASWFETYDGEMAELATAAADTLRSVQALCHVQNLAPAEASQALQAIARHTNRLNQAAQRARSLPPVPHPAAQASLQAGLSSWIDGAQILLGAILAGETRNLRRVAYALNDGAVEFRSVRGYLRELVHDR